MRTFVRFNAVGTIGFLVQVGTLIALDRVGVPLALGTVIAVEAAILHNFAWHERWTWAGMANGTRRGRLARFHVSNGLISIAGNVLIIGALAAAGTPVVAASVAAGLTCACLNFATAHLWVFCATTWPTFHGRLQ
jgi:putative flippase GtrA